MPKKLTLLECPECHSRIAVLRVPMIAAPSGVAGAYYSCPCCQHNSSPNKLWKEHKV